MHYIPLFNKLPVQSPRNSINETKVLNMANFSTTNLWAHGKRTVSGSVTCDPHSSLPTSSLFLSSSTMAKPISITICSGHPRRVARPSQRCSRSSSLVASFHGIWMDKCRWCQAPQPSGKGGARPLQLRTRTKRESTGIRSLQATDFFGLLGGKVGKVMLGDEGPSLGLGQQWQPQDV